MKKVNGVVAILLLAVSIMIGGLSAFAEDSSDQTNGTIQYSVAKISPGNEINESSPYYDLKVTKGEEKTIQARIYNASDEAIKVKSTIYTTFTNDNGQIAYTSAAEKYDSSLVNKISDFAKVNEGDQTVEVPAQGDVVVSATIKVPENASGVMLGSWYFEKEGQVDESKSQSGININNKYSYALAIKLTESDVEKPNLNLVSATAGLKNYQKVITANLQNDQATVMSNLSVKAAVTRKGSSEVLYTNNTENLIMAPNSNFNYAVFLGENAMRAGTYTISITATTTDPKWEETTWNFSKDFEITSEEASKSNKEAKNDPETPISIWWYVAGVILLVVLVGITVFYVTKRQLQKNKK